MDFNLTGKRKHGNMSVFTLALILTIFYLALIISLTGCASASELSSYSESSPTSMQDTEENPSSQSSPDKNDSVPVSTEMQENATLGTNTEGAFAADGIISNGEYFAYKDLEGIEIYWSHDSENVNIAIKAKTEGFVAIGLQPGRTMRDADIIFGFIVDNEVIIYDMFSTGNFGPHEPDIELGGTDDILEFNGNESGGFTIIEFSRKLVTGDEYDIDITSGTNKLIWAFGKSDNPEDKHSERGYGEIELK